jgi:hypothetical protein
MEKCMSRYVSLASLLLASTFVVQISVAMAATPQRTHAPSTNLSRTSTASHRADQKMRAGPPVPAMSRKPPQIYPPGPSGHTRSPSGE